MAMVRVNRRGPPKLDLPDLPAHNNIMPVLLDLPAVAMRAENPVQALDNPHSDEPRCQSVLRRTLEACGCTALSAFVALRASDFKEMELNGNESPGLMQKKSLVAVAFFHCHMTVTNGQADWDDITRNDVNAFRLTMWQPEDPIHSSKTAAARKIHATADEDDAFQFRKNIKPSVSDYPTFKDPAQWNQFREKWMIACDSHKLQSMHADPDRHLATNDQLDLDQRTFMFKVCQDKWLEPYSRNLVMDHKLDLDMRTMWKELKECHNGSMVTYDRAQDLLACLQTVGIEQWNGRQAEFISHFMEQVRQHDLLADPKMTDPAKVSCLGVCCIHSK